MAEKLRKIALSGFGWVSVAPLNWAQKPTISRLADTSRRPMFCDLNLVQFFMLASDR